MRRSTLSSKVNISDVEVARRIEVDVLKLLEEMARNRIDSHVHCDPNSGPNMQV